MSASEAAVAVGAGVVGGVLLTWEGVDIQYLRFLALAVLIRIFSVSMLSSSLGSYPPQVQSQSPDVGNGVVLPARTSRKAKWADASLCFNIENASTANAAFFFFSNLFRDNKVGRSLNIEHE